MPHTFRIHSDNRTHFTVTVWNTLAAMRAYLKLCEPSKRHGDALAACHAWEKDEHWPCLGVISFHKGHLSQGTVAHELAHAAFRWAETVKLPLAKISRHYKGRYSADPEERLCKALDRLTNEFYARVGKSRTHRTHHHSSQ